MNDRKEMTKLNAEEEQLLREYRGFKRTTYFRETDENGNHVDVKEPETVDTRILEMEILKHKKMLKELTYDRIAEIAPQTKINQALAGTLRDKKEQDDIFIAYNEALSDYDVNKFKIESATSIEELEKAFREAV